MCVPFKVRRKRYTLSVIWRRLRQPFRRYAHYKRAVVFCDPYQAQPLKQRQPFQSVLAIGNFSETTGLSRAFRAELKVLAKEYAGCDFRVQCLSTLASNKSDPIAPDHLILLSQPDTYAHILKLFRPLDLAKTYRTGFAVWEMPNFPKHWKPYLDCVHEIYTPSVFSAKALQKEMPDKVTLRPHQLLSCQVKKTASLSRQTYAVKEADFLGIAIMDLRTCPDRKNPHGTILAWQKAFADQNNKVLLLKARFSRHTQIIRQELKDLIGQCSNIRLIEDNFCDESMRSFQSLADVYISLHRAEGYGLNIAEMLALGKPTVVTDWSGNTDFTRNHPLVCSVPVSLIPYKDYLGIYHGAGLKWAEPDLNVAADHLQKIARNHLTSRASCVSQHQIEA